MIPKGVSTQNKYYRKVASTSGYSYINIEQQMAALGAIVKQVCNNKITDTKKIKQLIDNRLIRNENTKEIIKLLKGVW